jgi:hypothetical protein
VFFGEAFLTSAGIDDQAGVNGRSTLRAKSATPCSVVSSNTAMSSLVRLSTKRAVGIADSESHGDQIHVNTKGVLSFRILRASRQRADGSDQHNERSGPGARAYGFHPMYSHDPTWPPATHSLH